MSEQGSLLDYREPEWIAEKLGLDKNTVYKYLQEGWLPGVQLGRKWLISERLLAEHLERETRNQTAIRRKDVVQNKDLPFTPRLSRAIRLASEFAIGRGNDFTGTEHLLIGMVREGENVGVMVLRNLGIADARVQDAFESHIPAPASAKKVRQAPLTNLSNSALRHAREQALAMGHEYVGGEALLLGILLETGGMGYQILQSLGVSFDTARAEVLKLVRGRE